MRKLEYSGQFKRDVKQAQKRGKDIDKLKVLLSLLIDGDTLPAVYLDHPLKGAWRGYRDAHIEPDWLLIYKVTSKQLSTHLRTTHVCQGVEQKNPSSASPKDKALIHPNRQNGRF